MPNVRAFLMLFFLMACLMTSASLAQGYTYNLLYTFTGGADGGNPTSNLLLDSAGNLYGVTAFGGDRCVKGACGTVFELNQAGQLNVLYSFTGGADGGAPIGGLLRAGNLYGTAALGGTNGLGTIFQLNRKGMLTNLYSFIGGADGAEPLAKLIRDSAGNLYGTAVYGGDLNCGPQNQFPLGCGTVFELNTSGKLTVLHTFMGGSIDGAYPTIGPLVKDAAGNLYGVTSSGGSGTCNNGASPGGCGTAFKIDSTGRFTLLHSFTGGADGRLPQSVILAGNKLYGSTELGGDIGCPSFTPGSGCGVVFKMDLAGSESVLYAFTGGADGSGPGDLSRDASGNLYGGTWSGGDYNCNPGGCGTVFKLDLRHNLTVLHTFTGGSDETPSITPIDLVRDRAGNLYGTTNPFSNGSGTVFKLTP